MKFNTDTALLVCVILATAFSLADYLITPGAKPPISLFTVELALVFLIIQQKKQKGRY